MPDPVLVATSLEKSYGRHAVLRGVQLSVGPGLLVGIVGENGAGKSTLLRILASELAPSRGEVAVRGAPFDRRLVLSGYGQPLLLLAKLTALVVVAVAVALYATVVLACFWPSWSLPFVWLGFFSDALIYGGLGLLLGILVSSELAGFFIVIMVSLMDSFLQAPVDNTLANKPYLIAFPSYGPMQVAVSGAFTSTFVIAAMLLALAWFAAFALLGLGMFAWRTRVRGHRSATSQRLAMA